MDAGNERDALAAAMPQALAARVVSARRSGAALTVVLDASGLAASERTELERAGREAAAGLGVSEVRVALTADRAPPPRILAVGSGKGGVGKSTLAANLAVALSRSGLKVGLVDADIYGPSQPTILGIAGVRPEAQDGKLIPVPTPAGVPLLSMGQIVPAGRAIAWRGPMTAGALSQLIDADWGVAELLVVDLPPGTGDVQLTMIAKHKPAGAVLVSTPQDLALMDAARAGQLFDQAGVPIVGLVENMAGYACPHCGEVSDPFGAGGVEAAAERLGLPFLGRVPLSLALRESGDRGAPPAAGEAAEGEPFRAIAAKVAAWLAANP
ncbi:P-loop NTPase [Qipengyuania sediminis]|uniref:P-loop NTPase n=1 Tax=Qipengyuania sediminis TaxID=1532023 RepID=UPI00105A53C9|nr:P-loop NTPase [Qipengyuania sediminis]